MTDYASSIVLDASALIASIYEEKGFEIVDRYLSSAIISTVNLAEVAAYLVRQGSTVVETEVLLRDLALPVINYDETQVFLATELVKKTITKGLSLGDRACLALGILKNLPVLTADRVWKTIDVGVKIECIR